MRRLSALLPLLLLLAPLAHAQEVATYDLRLGEDPHGTASEHGIGGFNYGNSMLIVGSEEEFAKLHVASLRFPPGNQADEIDIGKADLDALLLNLGLLGDPTVLLVANLFSGSPEDAAELAMLARQAGVEVLAWEIGNEPDLFASNRADPTWTPDRYCREFRRFRAALLEVDIAYRFAGPGVSGSRPSAESYLQEVLRLCGDVIDILSWHIYPTDGSWSDEDALATAAQFTDEFTRYREWAKSPEHNPLGFEREIEFAVTEFGLSWRSPSFRHLEDMTAALWLADVLGQMTREGIDMSHYFTLQGMGGHGLIATGGWVRPTYHVYELLAGFWGEGVPVETSAPVRAYAVRNGDVRELPIVNPAASGVALRLDLPGAAPEVQAAVLDEAIFEESGEPQRRTVAVAEPLPVPARSLILLRIGTGND